MILYIYSYVVRNPFHSETRIDLKKISWEELSILINKVFFHGGEINITKASTQYNEAYSTLTYNDLDSYSLVCDERYGYLLGCSIFENDEYPEGSYLRLINKNEVLSEKIYTFAPFDDEWSARYVNQDIEIALKIFKEIYNHGYLSTESKQLFKDNLTS
ncbi:MULTISPECIES: hypothetical protein [Acinetobacter]|uniref:Uncharacterized protein n=1 Tax=Acinetobacter schindleri NIPH 900 TaxID=1217675 RepID=N8WQV4_9GAMM|nr:MULTISPECIES: hypothetical protein [Acinetobacter]AUX91497.1 hypothetical protein C3F22_17430 [Acinetobacter sp. ACNIH1]ENV14457.1 hypothetical protein F965_00323 [Acinetobacter schindleri NIPH 900]MCU4375683.1 hypothetical protein [Acinetobacter variabilis]QKW80911.1 hypothetical protein FOC32_00245 [Acinetobacter sp. FDAARGOS_724]